ncbi:MdlB ABC-type multidrug transport system, ATPase and permease components [Rhabdaerophilaceae bacterium]
MPGKALTGTVLKEILNLYRPHKRLVAIDFGCAALSGVLELGFPMAVRAFIDRLLPGQNIELIILAISGLLMLYLANAALAAVVTYWGHVLGIAIETELRRRAFDHLLKLPFRFFDDQKTGHLVGKLTKDLEDIGEVAHHGPEDILVALLTFAGAFVLMALVSPPLALITILIVPLVAWVVAHFGGKMMLNSRNQFARVGAFNARIEEAVGGIRVVKSFAREAHERRLFAQDNANYRDAKLDAYRIMAASTTLNYVGMRLVQLIVMLVGALMIVRGTLSIGDFVAFLLLVGVFYRPLDKMQQVVEVYPRGLAGYRNFRAFVGLVPSIADRPGAKPAPALRGDIAFSEITFAYSVDRPLFSHLSLSIAAGETVAFVGPSGAGKTTLVSLLPRFYDIKEGRITIDGMDIRDMTQASLRQQIGIVAQDVFLFAGTIRENIAYGRLDASEAEIRSAMARARLDELVDSLPMGLDTVIGERGVKLSGGQKQRLSIARVFLKDPPILILDEATSALDSETEHAIQASLADLAEGRTTLVVAHRLATIRNASRIVVITSEGIMEVGTHEALIEAEGHYRRLYDAQHSGTPQLRQPSKATGAYPPA